MWGQDLEEMVRVSTGTMTTSEGCNDSDSVELEKGERAGTKEYTLLLSYGYNLELSSVFARVYRSVGLFSGLFSCNADRSEDATLCVRPTLCGSVPPLVCL